RAFLPPHSPVSARDALLLGKDGYDILYSRNARPICMATLPGTVRPDWQGRAPCTCAATLNGETELSPRGTTRILSCPLASPRLAWAWNTLDGRPEVFMVTSLPGDEGSSLFAVLDYREWQPGQSFPRTVFKKPAQCTAPPRTTKSSTVRQMRPSPASRDCSTCHVGPAAAKLKKSGLPERHPENHLDQELRKAGDSFSTLLDASGRSGDTSWRHDRAGAACPIQANATAFPNQDAAHSCKARPWPE
ncbi:MAG TPA: hypothetical protein VHK44_10460, partial [Xanthobacteraceae bacterium]|nr:hypothetical protein [Xanthobacteraceae bacterium]